MRSSSKGRIPMLRISAISIALGLTACAGRTTVVQAPQPLQGLSVSGSGEASAAPDLARANIGVEVRALTADEATQAATAQMTAVMNALKQSGIADKDLRTHDFSINFEQEQTPQPPIVMQM